VRVLKGEDKSRQEWRQSSLDWRGDILLSESNWSEYKSDKENQESMNEKKIKKINDHSLLFYYA
jgi:hypothetical protein